MCGRYALTSPPELIATLFGVTLLAQIRARYNIAPTQAAPVVRKVSATAPRTLDPLRWGLIPHWAQDEKIASQTINARAESADTRPAFRNAFRHRRCLVPADGFYEWKAIAPKRKQPYFIHRKDGMPFAFAGLWERWCPPGDTAQEAIPTFTILTVPAGDSVRPLHDRMPAILHREDFDRWLDPTIEDPEMVKPLLSPFPDEALEIYPVSTIVNKPANESPRCIERVPEVTQDPDPSLF